MYLPTTHQRMTADEFATLPEGPPYFQLVERELFFMASPTRQHQLLVFRLAYSIETHLRAHLGIGQVYVSPSDVKLDEENAFEPDVYFVSRERESILIDQGATGAPDIVAEVLSPSTLRLDRAKKRAVYFQHGVRKLWFIEPDSQRVEIHLPDSEGAARTYSFADVLTTDVLPGWSVPVAELFD